MTSDWFTSFKAKMVDCGRLRGATMEPKQCYFFSKVLVTAKMSSATNNATAAANLYEAAMKING